MSINLASLLLSGLIGLALGIFGGGGSILAVPSSHTWHPREPSVLPWRW
jgi:uncharacterized membrane protein YfcA